MSEQERVERELTQRVEELKIELMKQYPTLIGTKMFSDLWKRESKLLTNLHVT